MRVEVELREYVPQRETALTVGVFDGVHLGHRQLLEYLKRQAISKDYLPGLVTFRSHPLHTISPESPISYLTGLDERISLVRQLGIDLVVPLSFDRDLAQIPARRFLALLQEHLKMRGMVVGPDFALGQNREGDVFALNALGKELGFWVDVIRPEMINGEVISSTAIRKALARGDISKVNSLLGRHFALTGKVAYGRGRGEATGLPHRQSGGERRSGHSCRWSLCHQGPTGWQQLRFCHQHRQAADLRGGRAHGGDLSCRLRRRGL